MIYLSFFKKITLLWTFKAFGYEIRPQDFLITSQTHFRLDILLGYEELRSIWIWILLMSFRHLKLRSIFQVSVLPLCSYDSLGMICLLMNHMKESTQHILEPTTITGLKTFITSLNHFNTHTQKNVSFCLESTTNTLKFCGWERIKE